MLPLLFNAVVESVCNDTRAVFAIGYTEQAQPVRVQGPTSHMCAGAVKVSVHTIVSAWTAQRPSHKPSACPEPFTLGCPTIRRSGASASRRDHVCASIPLRVRHPDRNSRPAGTRKSGANSTPAFWTSCAAVAPFVAGPTALARLLPVNRPEADIGGAILLDRESNVLSPKDDRHPGSSSDRGHHHAPKHPIRR